MYVTKLGVLLEDEIRTKIETAAAIYKACKDDNEFIQLCLLGEVGMDGALKMLDLVKSPENWI